MKAYVSLGTQRFSKKKFSPIGPVVWPAIVNIYMPGVAGEIKINEEKNFHLEKNIGKASVTPGIPMGSLKKCQPNWSNRLAS